MEENSETNQDQILAAKKILRSFNVMLTELGIICFGFGITSFYQFFYYFNYSAAIFNGLVFFWLLNTIRKVNFLSENA